MRWKCKPQNESHDVNHEKMWKGTRSGLVTILLSFRFPLLTHSNPMVFHPSPFTLHPWLSLPSDFFFPRFSTINFMLHNLLTIISTCKCTQITPSIYLHAIYPTQLPHKVLTDSPLVPPMHIPHKVAPAPPSRHFHGSFASPLPLTSSLSLLCLLFILPNLASSTLLAKATASSLCYYVPFWQQTRVAHATSLV
jgi:hypothetical protein